MIYGDDSDDILHGDLGDDTLMGNNASSGRGSDTFVIATGEGTDTILDFDVGVDFIALAGDLSFGLLDIVQISQDTAIQMTDATLAQLVNTVATDLTAEMFIPI